MKVHWNKREGAEPFCVINSDVEYDLGLFIWLKGMAAAPKYKPYEVVRTDKIHPIDGELYARVVIKYLVSGNVVLYFSQEDGEVLSKLILKRGGL